jgi:biopolymer transport protein ExbD
MELKTENKLLTVFSYSSLTDIVLLLLIFFLLSSSFVIQPGIKVQLPKAETGEVQTDRNIVITLTEKGRVFLNNQSIDKAQLGGHLAALLEADKDKVIVINADRTVTLQSAVDVIDIAKAVGASRFLVATQPPEARTRLR